MSNIYDRQKTLHIDSKMSITVIGAGGVGFHVAKLAAMSGIEKINIYDPDVIEETNLNRLDLPMTTIGKNKAAVAKGVINFLRPDALVYSFPFKFQDHLFNVNKTDWIVDCTDSVKVQRLHQEIADKYKVHYMKVGYDGEHITLANRVAEWGDDVEGYTTIPSWVVPAITVAALAVGKIMKYQTAELSTDLHRLYI